MVAPDGGESVAQGSGSSRDRMLPNELDATSDRQRDRASQPTIEPIGIQISRTQLGWVDSSPHEYRERKRRQEKQLHLSGDVIEAVGVEIGMERQNRVEHAREAAY